MFQSITLFRVSLGSKIKGRHEMKAILFVALILACPLGMLAMGVIAWLGAKLLPGRRELPTTTRPRSAE
jgi:hypothetical protein